MWGIFNPMGPTFGTVYLADVPTQDVALLIFEFINPFASESVVVGVVPHGTEEDPVHLTDTIRRMFRLNGSTESPLMNSLPTFIFTIQSPLDPNLLRDFFFDAAALAAPEDIDRDTLLLQEFRGNPWQRNSVPDVFGSATEAPTASPTWPPSRSSFNRWWDVVTDREHVLAELPHMQIAWEGSIKFQSDMGNQRIAKDAITWDEAIDHLSRIF